MNTFQLSCFLAVANTLSFAQAAKQVNISQPAITNQIRSLESELGAQLFHRTTRIVELTAEGQAFVEDAKNIITIAERARHRFSSTGHDKMDSISIACSSFAMFDLLPAILQELAACCTNLHPRLYTVPHNQLLKLLETEAADVLFDMSMGAEVTKKFTFQELKQCELVCVCPKDHPLAKQTSISKTDLENETLIFCNPMNLSPDIASLQWQFAREKSPVSSHYCDSAEAAVLLTASRLGIAILPELAVTKDERVVKVQMENAPKLSFGLFCRSRPSSGTVQKFIQITKQHFSE